MLALYVMCSVNNCFSVNCGDCKTNLTCPISYWWLDRLNERIKNKLNQIITEYGLTVSIRKTKSVAFKGRDLVKTKIVIDNKIIEQVNLTI